MFDFITDEELRASLENDLRELAGALEAGHWKSTHVLAGSVVEAVLIDYLIGSGALSREKALTLDLGGAVDACRKAGAISDRTEQLSTVIRGYRNLIHPGRVVRLNESISSDTAQVANSLVRIVAAEIEAKRQTNYGYTAAQVLAKMERDPGVDTVLAHLLKEVPAKELERLLLRVLPATATRLVSGDPFQKDFRATCSSCFRAAFGIADEDLKKKVASHFARIVREETSDIVMTYGDLFFRGSDLKYLSPADLNLVKGHLLGRLKKSTGKTTYRLLRGIGSNLQVKDVEAFLDPVIQANSSFASNSDIQAATEFISGESAYTSEDVDEAIKKRLSTWEQHFESKNMPVPTIVTNVRGIFDLPF